MSDDAKKEDPKAAKGAAKGAKGGPPFVVALVLPAILAGAAAYGGTRAAAKGAVTAAPEPEPTHHKKVSPPGPTVALEPFLVNTLDANRKGHPMKMTVAIEFEEGAHEEALKSFTPRIRDAILSHMRTLSFEDAVDSQRSEKLRTELLEKCKNAGAVEAERVLITDLVSQ